MHVKMLSLVVMELEVQLLEVLKGVLCGILLCCYMTLLLCLYHSTKLMSRETRQAGFLFLVLYKAILYKCLIVLSF